MTVVSVCPKCGGSGCSLGNGRDSYHPHVNICETYQGRRYITSADKVQAEGKPECPNKQGPQEPMP